MPRVTARKERAPDPRDKLSKFIKALLEDPDAPCMGGSDMCCSGCSGGGSELVEMLASFISQNDAARRLFASLGGLEAVSILLSRVLAGGDDGSSALDANEYDTVGTSSKGEVQAMGALVLLQCFCASAVGESLLIAHKPTLAHMVCQIAMAEKEELDGAKHAAIQVLIGWHSSAWRDAGSQHDVRSGGLSHWLADQALLGIVPGMLQLAAGALSHPMLPLRKVAAQLFVSAVSALPLIKTEAKDSLHSITAGVLSSINDRATPGNRYSVAAGIVPSRRMMQARQISVERERLQALGMLQLAGELVQNESAFDLLADSGTAEAVIACFCSAWGLPHHSDILKQDSASSVRSPEGTGFSAVPFQFTADLAGAQPTSFQFTATPTDVQPAIFQFTATAKAPEPALAAPPAAHCEPLLQDHQSKEASLDAMVLFVQNPHAFQLLSCSVNPPTLPAASAAPVDHVQASEAAAVRQLSRILIAALQKQTPGHVRAVMTLLGRLKLLKGPLFEDDTLAATLVSEQLKVKGGTIHPCMPAAGEQASRSSTPALASMLDGGGKLNTSSPSTLPAGRQVTDSSAAVSASTQLPPNCVAGGSLPDPLEPMLPASADYVQAYNDLFNISCRIFDLAWASDLEASDGSGAAMQPVPSFLRFDSSDSMLASSSSKRLLAVSSSKQLLRMHSNLSTVNLLPKEASGPIAPMDAGEVAGVMASPSPKEDKDAAGVAASLPKGLKEASEASPSAGPKVVITQPPPPSLPHAAFSWGSVPCATGQGRGPNFTVPLESPQLSKGSAGPKFSFPPQRPQLVNGSTFPEFMKPAIQTDDDGIAERIAQMDINVGLGYRVLLQVLQAWRHTLESGCPAAIAALDTTCWWQRATLATTHDRQQVATTAERVALLAANVGAIKKELTKERVAELTAGLGKLAMGPTTDLTPTRAPQEVAYPPQQEAYPSAAAAGTSRSPRSTLAAASEARIWDSQDRAPSMSDSLVQGILGLGLGPAEVPHPLGGQGSLGNGEHSPFDMTLMLQLLGAPETSGDGVVAPLDITIGPDAWPLGCGDLIDGAVQIDDEMREFLSQMILDNGEGDDGNGSVAGPLGPAYGAFAGMPTDLNGVNQDILNAGIALVGADDASGMFLPPNFAAIPDSSLDEVLLTSLGGAAATVGPKSAEFGNGLSRNDEMRELEEALGLLPDLDAMKAATVCIKYDNAEC